MTLQLNSSSFSGKKNNSTMEAQKLKNALNPGILATTDQSQPLTLEAVGKEIVARAAKLKGEGKIKEAIQLLTDCIAVLMEVQKNS